jgi:hypothetical protein
MKKINVAVVALLHPPNFFPLKSLFSTSCNEDEAFGSKRFLNR